MCVACDQRVEAILEAAALDTVEDLLGTIAGVEKTSDDLVPFELNLFGALRGEFRSFVRKFLRDEQIRDLVALMADPASHVALPGLNRQVSQSVLDAFHGLAGHRLGAEFAEAVEAEVGRELEAMYAASREAAAGAVGLPLDTFTVADANSLGVLRRHNLYWIRTNYARNVREGIERATAEAINQGLGRRALAAELRRQLGERFALVDNHWLTIASASLNRTRNVAQVRTYEIAEITHYEILAANDKRLCPSCEYMDGRVFSMETALSVVNELEAADTPEDVKRLMPWLRWDEARQAPFARIGDRRVDLPRGGTDSVRANRAVEKVAPLPPYHGRCVVGGTLVDCEDGPVPIEEVQPGRRVLTSTGDFNVIDDVHVSEAVDLVELTLEDGRWLRITPEHPVLTDRGWLPAMEVSVDDSVVTADGLVDRAVCQLCGFSGARSLQWHLRREHGLSAGEYRDRFPGASTFCRSARRKKAERARAQMALRYAKSSEDERRAVVASAHAEVRRRVEAGLWGATGRRPWNKGLTKEDDPRVMASSTRMHRANPMADPEVRDKVSGDNHWDTTGTSNPMYGRDPGRGEVYPFESAVHGTLLLRSRWEREYVEFFERQGIAYRYEPERFDLGGETYCPDFHLPDFDLYVEVKGRFHDRAMRKIAKFTARVGKEHFLVVRRREFGRILGRISNGASR